MKTFIGPASLEGETLECAVTIGTFDGVHLGHRSLIARCVARARDEGIEAAIVTWDRHPFMTLRPEHAPPMLSSPERKIELLEGTGADVLVVIPFDEEFSHWPPERFVDDVLVRGLGARAVVIGDGWRFGHKAAGDVDLLRHLGERDGFAVETIELQGSGDREIVSSSRIRDLVTSGAMEDARSLLGRPFDIDGLVVHGDGRGRDLGFPTANLEFDASIARPPRGVYAGRIHVGDSYLPAAISVGVNPTFGGQVGVSPIRIEAFILDFDGDIYGGVVRLEFWSRLRDELKFDSVDDLVAQMASDVDLTRSLVS